MKKVSSYLMKKYNIVINRCEHEHFTSQLELFHNVAPVSREDNKCIKCDINSNYYQRGIVKDSPFFVF